MYRYNNTREREKERDIQYNLLNKTSEKQSCLYLLKYFIYSAVPKRIEMNIIFLGFDPG